MSHERDPWSCLKGMEPSSLCDWPGRISLVLFFGGCNLKCPTCHNHHLAWKSHKLPALPKSDVLNHISKRRNWLDGLVVSGGEPTLQPSLADFLRELRKTTGLPVKVDTNGLRPDSVESILHNNGADLFAVDVKGPWDMYPDLTGGCCSPEKARTSLARIFTLARAHPDMFLFRCTRVPGLTDADLDHVRNVLPRGFTLSVQDFVPPAREEEDTKICGYDMQAVPEEKTADVL